MEEPRTKGRSSLSAKGVKIMVTLGLTATTPQDVSIVPACIPQRSVKNQDKRLPPACTVLEEHSANYKRLSNLKGTTAPKGGLMDGLLEMDSHSLL